MFAWRRPYPDVLRLYTGFIAAAGTGFAGVVAGMMVVHWRSVPVLAALGVGGFLGLWLTLAWRLHRTALLVGDAGVRVRWLLRTRTFPWSQVSQFRTAPDVLAGKRLWIVLADGRTVRTPVQGVTGMFGVRLNDGGTRLRGSRYDDLLDTLVRETRSRGVAPGT